VLTDEGVSLEPASSLAAGVVVSVVAVLSETSTDGDREAAGALVALPDDSLFPPSPQAVTASATAAVKAAKPRDRADRLRDE
jgi:hypothetical protein